MDQHQSPLQSQASQAPSPLKSPHSQQTSQFNIYDSLVNLLSSYYNDLKCGICHDLLDSPLECPKCSKYFCKRCLITWRETNNASEMICPLKCERVQFIQPHQLTRKYIQSFKELEIQLKKKSQHLDLNLSSTSFQNLDRNEQIQRMQRASSNQTMNTGGMSNILSLQIGMNENNNEMSNSSQLQSQLQRQMLFFESVQTLDSTIDKLKSHINSCDYLQVHCKVCNDSIQRKDFKDHAISCQQISRNLIKCIECGKDYKKEQEMRHYNKECTKSISCNKCGMRMCKEKSENHDCVQFLLLYKEESKRKKKMLRKNNERLQSLLTQQQKKYKELIRNDGHFCSFCEVPIAREEMGLMYCKLCNKMSCKSCKFENMFTCHDCKHSFCNKCSNQKKVLICDMHWNL